MELKCQLVIRMACNSGFAFTDGKGTLTKIAGSSSSSGLRLSGSSSSQNTNHRCTPHSCLPRWAVGAPSLLFPQEGKTGGRAFRQGQDEWAASHTRCRKGRAKFLLKAHAPPYFIFFLVTEILKVAFKGIRVPKNLRSLAFLEIAI